MSSYQKSVDLAETLFMQGRTISFVKKITGLTVADMVREGLVTETRMPGMGLIRVPVGQKMGGK